MARAVEFTGRQGQYVPPCATWGCAMRTDGVERICAMRCCGNARCRGGLCPGPTQPGGVLPQRKRSGAGRPRRAVAGEGGGSGMPGHRASHDLCRREGTEMDAARPSSFIPRRRSRLSPPVRLGHCMRGARRRWMLRKRWSGTKGRPAMGHANAQQSQLAGHRQTPSRAPACL